MAGAECDIRDSIVLVLRDSDRTQHRTVNKKDGGKVTTAGYVGKISVPMEDGKYFIEFMLTESDLTDELKKLRDEKMKQILGREK